MSSDASKFLLPIGIATLSRKYVMGGTYKLN